MFKNTSLLQKVEQYAKTKKQFQTKRKTKTLKKNASSKLIVKQFAKQLKTMKTYEEKIKKHLKKITLKLR